MTQIIKATTLILISAFALCAGIGTLQAKQIRAVASFSVLADIVSQIGGEHVSVISLVGPNADAHVYEPKPQDAVALSSADIIFVNGLGFEGWMERLQQVASGQTKVIVASKGIVPLIIEEGGQQLPDPHAWQSPANGLIYARNVADALCGVDREDCGQFKGSLEEFGNRMKLLDDDFRNRISHISESKRQVITTHDAFAYFGAAYGIRFLAAEGISTESEPSAQNLAKLISQMRHDQISALFLENMEDPRILEQIARETGVQPGGTLFADALSKPGEGGATYLDMLKHNGELLISAMAGTK